MRRVLKSDLEEQRGQSAQLQMKVLVVMYAKVWMSPPKHVLTLNPCCKESGGRAILRLLGGDFSFIQALSLEQLDQWVKVLTLEWVSYKSQFRAVFGLCLSLTMWHLTLPCDSAENPYHWEGPCQVWPLDLGLPNFQNCDQNKILFFINYPVLSIQSQQ